eukprot:3779987-Prymnesium_polylepis.1
MAFGSFLAIQHGVLQQLHLAMWRQLEAGIRELSVPPRSREVIAQSRRVNRRARAVSAAELGAHADAEDEVGGWAHDPPDLSQRRQH